MEQIGKEDRSYDFGLVGRISTSLTHDIARHRQRIDGYTGDVLRFGNCVGMVYLVFRKIDRMSYSRNPDTV